MVLWWCKGEFLVTYWCSRCHRGHTHMTKRHSAMGARHLFPPPKHQIRKGFSSFFVTMIQMCDFNVSLLTRKHLWRPSGTIRDHLGQVPDALRGEAEGNALRATSLRSTNRSHQTLFHHKTHLEPSWKLKTSKKKKKKNQGHLALHEGPSNEMHRCLIYSWVENGVQLC